MSKPIQSKKLEEMIQEYLSENCDLANVVSSEPSLPEISSALLEIDRETGLSYCMNMTDLYQEMLETFCQQAKETLEQLENSYQLSDWANYAILTHGLKTNARTIGANNFAELSLQHEMAGKEKNEAFIHQKYLPYISALKQLVKNIEKM